VKAVLVGAAGAAGALARYGIGLAVGTRGFPYATLAINVSGSFVLAVLLTYTTRRGVDPIVTVPLAVGLLGAYTTWSTFSWETFTMLKTGDTARAVAYVGLSVAVSLVAVLAGYRLGQRLA
jgi:CrcB protein